jgi:hypothetical protein
MINARFAAPVAALLGLALVPTGIHSYRGVRIDDGLRSAAIASSLSGMTSSPTARRAAWVQNNLDSDDWVERVYKVDGHDVTLFVARSYDPKRLYHHPELAVLRGTQTTPRGVMQAADRPQTPLHVIDTERGSQRGVAVFALLYDGSFIANPLTFQLKTSVELLFRGRQPLTLFMSSALAGSLDNVDDAPATRLLLEAIEAFERQVSDTASR